MFDSVLVPVDARPASARALGTALTVARAAGCPIVLLTVVSPGAITPDLSWFHELADDLDVAAERRFVAINDRPAAAILDLQKERAGSLVCMATSAHTGPSEIVFGSVAVGVVRGMHQSLVLVGPQASAPEKLRDIQACLDGSDVAEAAARTAAVWASLLGLRIHLVRVAPPSTAADPHDATTDLEAVAHRLRVSFGVQATWDVLHDDAPASALVDHARRLPASLIAMTTHGCTGAFHRLIGTTAMRVVHAAPCPVLVVPR